MSKKLFIVVIVDWFFLSHRKEIAIAAKNSGFDVTIISYDTGNKDKIESLGLNFINLPKPRSIQNIFKEFNIFLYLLRIYKDNKPDIIHHVGLKLILYGTIAAKIAGIKNVVNAISGLGIIFSNE
ncbi:glycosyltransferase [Treponema primitia]|uniref:glycosyltransferase n=1 Tax=Treponema primitia TaxID=88058 RepID=UPI0002DA559B|nr:glycosyltransferase [Treponema primitia]